MNAPLLEGRSSECQVDCVNLLIPGVVDVVSDSQPNNIDMPRVDELVASVRDFLHGDVMQQTQGRTNFMARVAGNSLDIVLRDLSLGPQARSQELDGLRQLYSVDADLPQLRERLVDELRSGQWNLSSEKLQQHLRTTVVNQVAIDQPRYSGYQTAINQSGGHV